MTALMSRWIESDRELRKFEQVMGGCRSGVSGARDLLYIDGYVA